MRAKTLGCLLAALLALPSLAGATTITWRLQGTVTDVDGLSGLGIQVGDSFSVLLHFDDAANLINQGTCGIPALRCIYNGASIALSELSVGPFGPFDPSFDAGDPGQIIVRNNATVGGGATLFDGVTFARQDLAGDGSVDNWGVIFRTEDLSALSSNAIPTSLDTLMQMTNRVFQFCSSSDAVNAPNACDLSSLNATITSASRVPEPGTLGLLGLGLLGLSASRRRRA